MGGIGVWRAWCSPLMMIGLVALALGGAWPAVEHARAAWGECADPWLTDAIWQVTGRAPEGEGYEGECDIYRYNDASWNSYDELVGYVEDELGDSGDWSGECDDPWVTDAIWQVTGRAPYGENNEGECNIYLYNGGSWNSYDELVGYVADTLGAPSSSGGSDSSGFTCSGDEAAPFSDLDFDQLDWGLYWFGYGNTCQQFVYGEENPYYDPDRPTLIYVHGWQINSSPSEFRESYFWTDTGENLGDAWLDDGWNIGIFYWNQFADEQWFWQAESKIWTATGEEGMRWRARDGDYYDGYDAVDGYAAAELFALDYLYALEDQDFGEDVRIVGHSLGSQMAVRMTWLVMNEAPEMLPDRVALLDPAFSAGEARYLNDGSGYASYTADRVNQLVGELRDTGVAFELYQTTPSGGDSGFGFGVADSNPELHDLTAYAHLYPSFSWSYKDNHVHAIYWYFMSYAYPVHQCNGDSGAWYDELAPSAAVSTEEIAWFMGEDYRFEQDQGYGSYEVADDCLALYYR